MWYIQSFFSLIAYTGKNCESEIVVCRNTTCLNNGTYSSELTSDREVNKHCHCSPEYGGDLCEFKLICTLHEWISVWWCRVETKLHCRVISVNTSLAMPETNVLDLHENLPSYQNNIWAKIYPQTHFHVLQTKNAYCICMACM